MPLPMFDSDSKRPIDQIQHVIAITSCKGGVGKSTLTVLLAEILAAQNLRVGILDADVYGPSIRHLLPEDREPSSEGNAIRPALSRGIELISMAHFRNEGEAAALRAPMVNSVIKQFIENVEWSPLDCLLIDFPPGTGDIHLSLAQQIPLSGAVTVTTPQQVALLDARKGMELFDRLQVPHLGVIENMSYMEAPDGSHLFPFGKGGGRDLAQSSGIPFLGELPLIPEVGDCLDRRGSVLNDLASHPIIQELISLSQKILSHAKSVSNQEGDVLRSFDIQWRAMENVESHPNPTH